MATDTPNLIDTVQNPDAITPTQSSEQIDLWEALDDIYDVPELEREKDFIDAGREKRAWLASIGLAEDISRIATRLSLTLPQAKNLGTVIRYVALEELPFEGGVTVLRELFKLNAPLQEQLEAELRALLGIAAPKAPVATTTAPPSPSEPSRPVDTLASPVRESSTPPPPDELPPEKLERRGDEPFMLHEEAPEPMRETPKNNPSVSFELPGVVRQKTPKPITAKVESPEGSPRVVHYSDLRTPLDREGNR